MEKQEGMEKGEGRGGWRRGRGEGMEEGWWEEGMEKGGGWGWRRRGKEEGIKKGWWEEGWRRGKTGMEKKGEGGGD